MVARILGIGGRRDLEGIEIGWHPLQHVVTHPVDGSLAGFSTTAARVLRLNLDDRVQHFLPERLLWWGPGMMSWMRPTS